MTQFKKKSYIFTFFFIDPPAYARKHDTPTSGCCEDFWLKGVFLLLACDVTIKKKNASDFVPKKYWGAFFGIGASIRIGREI